jgi:hypothetical protein
VPAVIWLAWLYLVIFESLIAFSAYMLLLARTSASVATSYALVNPVVALLLEVTAGGETVSSWEWLSAGVILIGVILLLSGRRRQQWEAQGECELGERTESARAAIRLFLAFANDPSFLPYRPITSDVLL